MINTNTFEGRIEMTKDLTVGNPQKVLWKFTIPMFISVMFQQFYSMADSLIAGKYAGEEALAAVGASFPITFIFLAVAVGFNVGCSVVISRLFGAKKYANMKSAISTAVLASLIIAGIMSVVGIIFTPDLMRLINTPGNIFADGSIYLKIYVAGFTFLFLYNISTGIFTSLGDSMTPLYFLIGSSMGNVYLDIVFVKNLHMGVAGVAWDTFIAQGIACVLALAVVFRRLRTIEVKEKYKKFSRDMLSKIGQIAVPSILQQSFISVGNIFVQSIINGYGSSVIAGYSAAVKLNGFGIACFLTMGTGMSNYTSQNIGAKKFDRVHEGLKSGILMAIILSAPFFLILFFNAEGMLKLFMNEESSVALNTGIIFLRTITPFYFVVSLKVMVDGVLRGAGAMKYFMIATFIDLILRVILAYVFSAAKGANGIWAAWNYGWTIATVATFIFYFDVRKKMKEHKILEI